MARRSPGGRAAALVALAFPVAGMTIAPPQPSAQAMAATFLATVAVVCAPIGRLPQHPASTTP